MPTLMRPFASLRFATAARLREIDADITFAQHYADAASHLEPTMPTLKKNRIRESLKIMIRQVFIEQLRSAHGRIQIQALIREELERFHAAGHVLSSGRLSSGRPAHPAIMCAHANEVPKVCRCDSDCACRQIDATCTSQAVILWRRS